MTPADRIILIETRAMIDRFMSITDTLEFSSYVHGLYTHSGINAGDLEKLTGVKSQHIIDRKRAAGAIRAEQNGSVGYPEQFKPYVAIYDGVKLNRTDHGLEGWEPWTDDWWLKECPPRWSDHVLREAVSRAAQVPWIAALYLQHDKRLPDQAGFEYWTEIVAEGMPEDEAARLIVEGFEKARAGD